MFYNLISPNKNDLKKLHPPPPPPDFFIKKGKEIVNKSIKVSFRIDKDILKERMNAAGYKNRSLFLRELVEDSSSNELRSQMNELCKKVDTLMDIANKSRMPLYNRSSSMLVPVGANNDSAIFKTKLPITSKSVPTENKSLKMIVLEIKEKLFLFEGNIQSILSEVPNSELEKPRPKTDHHAFTNFKHNLIKAKV